jgi:site-specific recombinase XerC
LAERREAVKIILGELIYLLKDEGYNPISKIKVPPFENNYEIPPTTHWLAAIEKAKNRLILEKSTLADMKSCLTKLKIASDALKFSTIPVSEISRKHIKIIFEYLEVNDQLSAHRYNKYRCYLMIFFKELMELETVESNPIRDISKRKTIKKIRELLSDKERQKIDNYLKPNFYTFWRFINIFFHSGARENEMLALQAKNIDVEKHRFKLLIKKGRQQREVYRTIKDIALPLWIEVIKDAKPDDYLFSIGLKPGPKKIIREQITRRWNVHVKKKLNISADFYSLKHLNIDETADALDIKDASEMAGHTTPVITTEHYALNEKERQHERLRKVNNSFV